MSILKIPKACATPSNYISFIPALNLRLESESTGDWHSNMFLVENFTVQPHMIAGDGCQVNSNPTLGSLGIRDMKQQLMAQCQTHISLDKIYVANHYRAIADLLLQSVIRDPQMRSNQADISTICSWLDTDEQVKELRDNYLRPMQKQLHGEQIEVYAGFLKMHFNQDIYFY